jgi:hypothetical protein
MSLRIIAAALRALCGASCTINPANSGCQDSLLVMGAKKWQTGTLSCATVFGMKFEGPAVSANVSGPLLDRRCSILDTLGQSSRWSTQQTEKNGPSIAV